MNEQNRDFGKEIDELREALEKVMAFIQAQNAKEAKRPIEDEPSIVGHVQKNPGMHPNEHIMALMSDAEDACGQNGETGRITYLGVFASGGNQSSWIKNNRSTDELLTMAENGSCESILTCFSSQEKLSILIALLRQPRTVAQLVEDLQFGSTGQVYHHLQPLARYNIVEEDPRRRGCYEIVPRNVQGIIMILSGIADILETV